MAMFVWYGAIFLMWSSVCTTEKFKRSRQIRQVNVIPKQYIIWSDLGAWREVTLFSLQRVKMAYILVILLTASIYILHGLRTDSTQPYLSKIRQQVIRNNHTVRLKTTNLIFSMLNWVVYRKIWFQEEMSTKLLEYNLLVIYVEGLSPNPTWLISSRLHSTRFDMPRRVRRVERVEPCSNMPATKKQ